MQHWENSFWGDDNLSGTTPLRFVRKRWSNMIIYIEFGIESHRNTQNMNPKKKMSATVTLTKKLEIMNLKEKLKSKVKGTFKLNFKVPFKI